MKKSPLIKTIIFFLFILVIGTPLFYGGSPRIFGFQFISQQVYPYTLSKQVFFQAVAELIFGLWLALIILDRKFRPKFTPAVKALTVFLAVLTLAAFSGVDPWRSFWSTYERAVGVVAIYHLAALGLVLSSLWEEVPWRKFFFASIGTSLLADIFAWLQLGIPDLLLIENKGLALGRPGSTFGNPTFLDGYLIFNIFIVLYLLLERYSGGGETTEKSQEKWRKNEKKSHNNLIATFFLLSSIFINLITIFLSQTRGDIIAIGFGFLALLFLFALRPPELRFQFLRSRALYAAVLLAVIIFSLSFWLTKKSPVWNGVPGLNRFKDLSFSLQAQDFVPRLIALEAAYKGFLDRPILGWGPENFNIVFNKYYDPRALESSYQETRFDKPHNFVAEYLVTGGVLLTLAYFAFLALAFWEARRQERLFGDVMLAGFVTYFVANFFVFETIGPLLMLYLVFGYSDGAYRRRRYEKHEFHPDAQNKNARADKPSGGKIYAAFASIIAAVVLAYVLNFQTFLASYDHYWAFQYMGQGGRFSDGISYFKKAIGVWTPYRWNFKRDYAAAVVEAYFYNPGAISANDTEDALAAMEQARDEHPLDAYNHYALVDLYNEVSDINPQEYLPLAEKEAAIALELSPNRQEVYFSLAKTKTLEKNYPAALDLLKKAVALDPKVADAHFYYGLVAYTSGDNATGYSEIEEALALGRQWGNADEPRVAANFFADSGHLNEAIGLYKESLSLAPSNPETKIKLGIAYFFAGQRDLAKEYVSEVAAEYDLRQSPSFEQLKPILESLGIKY